MTTKMNITFDQLEMIVTVTNLFAFLHYLHQTGSAAYDSILKCEKDVVQLFDVVLSIECIIRNCMNSSITNSVHVNVNHDDEIDLLIAKCSIISSNIGIGKEFRY